VVLAVGTKAGLVLLWRVRLREAAKEELSDGEDGGREPQVDAWLLGTVRATTTFVSRLAWLPQPLPSQGCAATHFHVLAVRCCAKCGTM